MIGFKELQIPFSPSLQYSKSNLQTLTRSSPRWLESFKSPKVSEPGCEAGYSVSRKASPLPQAQAGFPNVTVTECLLRT